MSSLPTGWEFDYDGSRWFYRYRPTGLTQFHFPREGDEFPEFIGDDTTALDLAPEEKLESQQQVRRIRITSKDSASPMDRTIFPASSIPKSAHGEGSSSEPAHVSAVGGPMDNDDDGGFYYQPESFMFLGPGAFNDVSPLGDEDDREILEGRAAAKGKRPNGKDTAKDGDVAAKSSSKVSPLQSETTTPQGINSEPAKSHEHAQTEPESGVNTRDVSAKEDNEESFSAANLRGSHERPQELPGSFTGSSNPVGVLAEMADPSVRAHIELHPEPVEMGDHQVLAPIETRFAPPEGIAELAERTSPIERNMDEQIAASAALHQTSMSNRVLYKATFGSRPLGQPTAQSSKNEAAATRSNVSKAAVTTESQRPQPAEQDTSSSDVPGPSQRRIARKPTNARSQPAALQDTTASTTVPSSAAVVTDIPRRKSVTFEIPKRNRGTLAAANGALDNVSVQQMHTAHHVLPEPPTDLQGRSSAPPSSLATTQTPAAINEPASSPGHAAQPGTAGDSLTHMPSVLKPARGRPAVQSQQQQSQQQHNPMIAPRPYMQQGYQPSRSQQHPAPPAPTRSSTLPAHLPADPVAGQPQFFPPYTAVSHISAQGPGQQPPPSSGMDRKWTRREPVEPPYPVTPQMQPAVLSSASSRNLQHQYSTPPVPPKQPARQTSDGVSLFSPSSESQSSEFPMQTPSPPVSSGYSSTQPSVFFSVPGQSVPNQTPGAQDSGPRREQSPGPIQWADMPDAAARPSVPRKIPVEDASRGAEFEQASDTQGSRSSASGAAAGSTAHRRHSLAIVAQFTGGPSYSVAGSSRSQTSAPRPKKDPRPVPEQQPRAPSQQPSGQLQQPTPATQPSVHPNEPAPGPGHSLLPIQESHEGEEHHHPQPVRRNSQPANQPQPLVAPQRPAQIRRSATQPLDVQQSHTATDPGLGSHVSMSTVSTNPAQTQSRPQAHHRSASSPQGLQNLFKEKEKGGWLSKLKKNANKASSSQKSPSQPAQQYPGPLQVHPATGQLYYPSSHVPPPGGITQQQQPFPPAGQARQQGLTQGNVVSIGRTQSLQQQRPVRSQQPQPGMQDPPAATRSSMDSPRGTPFIGNSQTGQDAGPSSRPGPPLQPHVAQQGANAVSARGKDVRGSVAGPSSAQDRPGKRASAYKWLQQPAADYSGEDWGQKDSDYP